MKGPTPGFTLLEVIIAVSITAFIGALMAASLRTTFLIKDDQEAMSDRYRQLRVAMSRITREVGSAYLSNRYDPQRYRDANDRPTNFIGSDEKLLFTSLAHQRLYTDAKESDQMVVEYQVKSVSDAQGKSERQLMRREKVVFEEAMDRGGSEDVLMDAVQKIEFQYWDSDKKEWVDEWDTRKLEKQNILPTRVRVTLTAQDETGKEVRYSTQTRIMLNTALEAF